MNKKIISLLLVLLIVLTGCNPETPQPDPQPTPDPDVGLSQQQFWEALALDDAHTWGNKDYYAVFSTLDGEYLYNQYTTEEIIVAHPGKVSNFAYNGKGNYSFDAYFEEDMGVPETTLTVHVIMDKDNYKTEGINVDCYKDYIGKAENVKLTITDHYTEKSPYASLLDYLKVVGLWLTNDDVRHFLSVSEENGKNYITFGTMNSGDFNSMEIVGYGGEDPIGYRYLQLHRDKMEVEFDGEKQTLDELDMKVGFIYNEQVPDEMKVHYSITDYDNVYGGLYYPQWETSLTQEHLWGLLEGLVCNSDDEQAQPLKFTFDKHNGQYTFTVIDPDKGDKTYVTYNFKPYFGGYLFSLDSQGNDLVILTPVNYDMDSSNYMTKIKTITLQINSLEFYEYLYCDIIGV